VLVVIAIRIAHRGGLLVVLLSHQGAPKVSSLTKGWQPAKDKLMPSRSSKNLKAASENVEIEDQVPNQAPDPQPEWGQATFVANGKVACPRISISIQKDDLGIQLGLECRKRLNTLRRL